MMTFIMLGCATPPADTDKTDPALAAQVKQPGEAPEAATQGAAAASPAPVPIRPLPEALQAATAALFDGVPQALGERLPLVIDPLIDGNSWVQSNATQNMEKLVLKTVSEKYPRFEPMPFTSSSLVRGPYVFIGTFTALDNAGKSAGPTEWYRICLALLDVRSGKIVSKGFARAAAEGVDHTPLPFFQNSPGWTKDKASSGYVSTCQGTKAGDPINPDYWDKLATAAVINDAIRAYHDNRLEDSLDLYRAALRMPGGHQLRVFNGLYLTQRQLNRPKESAAAFGDLVDYGLGQKQISVKFLFQPGSTLFLNNAEVRRDYSMWLAQIGNQSAKSRTCLQVVGHTSRSGAEPLNERLSLQRATQVRQQIVNQNKRLAGQLSAAGLGSSKAIVGSGTDDARDAVDRRVEFAVADCKSAG
ncbi:MAG: OmpA family protein [Comamonadaceae bacterium]|nr:OmpA family protein [Comamonadaceae bacterium]